MLKIRDLWTAFCVLLSFVFYGNFFLNNVAFRPRHDVYAARLIARWRHGSCCCQAVIRNEGEIFNVGMSKPPKMACRPARCLRGAVSAPAVYGAAPRSKQYGSKMKKKYYLKLKDMLITRCCVLRTFLGRPTYKLLTDNVPIVQAF